MRPAPWRGCP
uniref:Uncharacterized protein n=1 Tax=Arundo donax TaxID=35708 RepID=A0A0A8YVT9_ARUDO